MPNPGDAGSSLGAAASLYNQKLRWKGPYLGTEIKSKSNPKEIARYLYDYSVCGVASGRAEFGPRALGNRSLLADHRHDIKDTVNDIKQRQKFRPFAPAILEEYADEYFEGPMNEYMQFVAKAKHDYKSVTHVDGTARVQIVKKDCESIIRKILEEWIKKNRFQICDPNYCWHRLWPEKPHNAKRLDVLIATFLINIFVINNRF